MAERSKQARELCHRAVPERAIGDKIVVARPDDGSPVVLAPTAAIIWRALDDWTTPVEVGKLLAAVFPTVSDTDRTDAVADAIALLAADDLIERR